MAIRILAAALLARGGSVGADITRSGLQKMTKIAASLGLLFCLLPAFGAAKSSAMDSYLYIKEDESQYCGEGTAGAGEFGDAARASKAARERALEALAGAIRVQVTSKTSEKIESKGGKSSEEIRSEGESRVEITLNNVKYLELPDFPDRGKLTVLAHLSKEDYLRQLAGKGAAVYRPQFGLSVGVDMLNLDSFSALVRRSAAISSPNYGGVSSSGGNEAMPMVAGTMVGYAAELSWPFMLLGAAYFQQNQNIWGVHRSPTAPPGMQDTYSTNLYSLTMLELHAGYDYIPWAWRFQPYLPVRVRAGFLELKDTVLQGTYKANLYGASAGLGLRYWLNGEFSLEGGAMANLALNSASLSGGGSQFGGTLAITPSESAPALDFSGSQFFAKIKWSGF